MTIWYQTGINNTTVTVICVCVCCLVRPPRKSLIVYEITPIVPRVRVHTVSQNVLQ